MTATCCERPGCDGVIEASGFCGTCGRLPHPEGPPAPPSAVPQAPSAPARAWALPVFDFPDPRTRILADPHFPERDRRCARCEHPVGRARQGRPALASGYCPSCGHRFSFLPGLKDGDLVAGRYEVSGCFARGGFGWVYLARDRHLDSLVVLKGMIDEAQAPMADAERRALIMLDHPNIVRIRDFVAHPDAHTKQSREYIVMSYVDGPVLNDIRKESARGALPLGEALRAEHVAVCGVRILAALGHLHGLGLLYCDMKPENVILQPGQRGEEEASRVKLIDLGAVHKMGDRDHRVIGTQGYQVGSEELKERGATVQSDLHTVAVTLTRLLDVTADKMNRRPGDDRVEVGLESFRRLLARAGHHDPDRRFASAAQMSEQLEGVYREISALRDGTPHPHPSTLFAPTAGLLDAGLSVVPPLERWIRGGWSPELPPPLDLGSPIPIVAALGLPVPLADPADPAAVILAALDDRDPGRLLDTRFPDGGDTAEIRFARCRAHLEVGDLDGMDADLERAAELLGEAAARDWRVRWHHGLRALATGEFAAAEREFGAVYDAVPGEEAPKVALGYCAEAAGQAGRAELYYQAVWCRDHRQASAGFGLARIRLARGDRAGAMEVLDGIPPASRHSDVAGVARVLTLSGRLGGSLPDARLLSRAAGRLADAYVDDDARDRLTTVIQEAAFARIRADGGPLPADGGAVFGRHPDEHTLRLRLERSYFALAEQARDAGSRCALVDRAHAIRPMTIL
ncbi:tetratricopeptide repeat protein [Nonomuraea rubra]|uniref:tetratricopeptide repeat protein n=1 Tax=Nonomuraea rubra TaxID=46180 RepID=UPI0033F19EC2